MGEIRIEAKDLREKGNLRPSEYRTFLEQFKRHLEKEIKKDDLLASIVVGVSERDGHDPNLRSFIDLDLIDGLRQESKPFPKPIKAPEGEKIDKRLQKIVSTIIEKMGGIERHSPDGKPIGATQNR